MGIRLRELHLRRLGRTSMAMQAWGQEDPHANCAMVGWVPEGILERPLPLRAATGNSVDAVTTSSSEARAYYLQGLNYLHGYAWIEGARSFHAGDTPGSQPGDGALGIEPHLFGSRRSGESRQRSHARARARESASAREQRRIALRVQQLGVDLRISATGLVRRLQAGHRQGDRRRHRRRRVVADPRQCRGTHGRGSRPARRRGVDGFLSGGAAAGADNGAAHHYLTHSYENLNQISRALEHGEVYARIAADIPHAHHMWGHDLRRVGRLDEAIAAFTSHQRDGKRLLRRGKDTGGARLASRAQPRSARDFIRAQGADAPRRGAAARSGGGQAGDRIPDLQPEVAHRISAGAAALA